MIHTYVHMCWLSFQLPASSFQLPAYWVRWTIGQIMVLDRGGVNLGMSRIFDAWAYFVTCIKPMILQGVINESGGSEESDAESV